MNRIYKYELNVTDHQVLELPFNAKILSVQVQKGLCLWAVVDPDLEKENVEIFMFGTGQLFNSAGLTYLSTFQMIGGTLVFHVFEGRRWPLTKT